MRSLASLIALLALATTASAQEWFYFEWDDAPPDHITLATVDSLASAWIAEYQGEGHLLRSSAADVVDDSTDINGDGFPDLVLSDLPTCGNAGCPRLIYLGTGGGDFELAGEAFYHDMAFWLCPGEPGSGRLVYYHRMNAAEGGMNTLHVAPGSVELVDSRPWVWERDFADGALMREVLPEECSAGGF